MAKFLGVVGYVELVETVPGVWVEVATERRYSGNIIKNTQRWEDGKAFNATPVINNVISIIADQFAYLHLHTIRYVKWAGVLWKITNIEVQRPRLVLTLGGVYNEQTPTTT